MNFKFLLILGTVFVAVVSCSRTALVNFISPSGHYEKIADLSYGSLPRQKLDLYIPKKEIRNDVLIIFFYGGSWDSGNKEKYKFVASSLSKQGYTVAIPDYRLYPDVIFPDFMQDAASSIAWLQKDQNHLMHIQHTFLMGHSAGAQVASLLMTDGQYFNKVNVDESRLQGCIGLAGPYDFLPLSSNRLKEIFPEKVRNDSQPIHYVEGDEIPFLLLHGLKDTTVLPKNSKAFAEKIMSKDGKIVSKFYPDVGHVDIIKPFVRGLEDSAPTVQDINQFIEDIIKRKINHE